MGRLGHDGFTVWLGWLGGWMWQGLEDLDRLEYRVLLGAEEQKKGG